MDPDNATGLVVGMGDFVYDVFRPWGVLPAGWTFGSISHVAVDSKDRVYFYQRKNPPVLVFDGAGNFLTGWGDGRLRDAHGIYVSRDDHVYVCNRDEHEVIKLTPEGRIILALGQRGRPSLQAPFNHPADVAVAPNGDIYVADGYGNSASTASRPRGSTSAPGVGRAPARAVHDAPRDLDRRKRAGPGGRPGEQPGPALQPRGRLLGEWRDLYHPMDIYVDPAGPSTSPTRSRGSPCTRPTAGCWPGPAREDRRPRRVGRLPGEPVPGGDGQHQVPSWSDASAPPAHS